MEQDYYETPELKEKCTALSELGQTYHTEMVRAIFAKNRQMQWKHYAPDEITLLHSFIEAKRVGLLSKMQTSYTAPVSVTLLNAIGRRTRR